MNKNSQFSAEALILLHRITASCVAVCTQDMEAFKKYVKNLASLGKPIKYGDFVRKSPSEVVFMRDIAAFANEIGCSSISGNVILKFFGSRWHINKILADIRENVEDPEIIANYDFRHRFLFDHTLTNQRVSLRSNGEIHGMFTDYSKNFSFETGTLEPFPGLAVCSEKCSVLVHFKKIICVDPPQEVVAYIAREQEKSQEFREALSFLAASERM